MTNMLICLSMKNPRLMAPVENPSSRPPLGGNEGRVQMTAEDYGAVWPWIRLTEYSMRAATRVLPS